MRTDPKRPPQNERPRDRELRGNRTQGGRNTRHTQHREPDQEQQLSFEQRARRALLKSWKDKWKRRPPPWGEHHGREPDKRILELHKGLKKARSTLIIQLRSGETGLAGFLHRRHVPGFESPACSRCGYHIEDVRHVLVHCEAYSEWRMELVNGRGGGRVDCKWLLDTVEGTRVLTSWWLRRDILHQFNLARVLEKREGEADRDEEI